VRDRGMKGVSAPPWICEFLSKYCRYHL